MKKKVLRIAALPGSLGILLKGQLKFLNQHYEVIGVASDDPTLNQLAEQEEIQVIPVTINRRISVFQDIASLIKLYWVFRKEKPHIVHSITPKAGLLSMTAGFFARVPHRAHTFTGLVFPTSKGFLKKMLIFFDKVICYCATDIYPEGQGVKNDLLNYSITKKDLKIIGHGNVNGINLSHYDPSLYGKEQNSKLRKELNIDEDDFVFLFVGRMGADKGISELISAFVETQKQDDTAKLVLVGTFEKEHDPIPETTSYEIENNAGIIFVGWQTDVRPYFAISNIFILPSYREGFPNVVLQAGAMGKFSIVTDINGSNEIIENGVNGKIVPVRDSGSLENVMTACLKNPTIYKTNLNYRKIIEEKYEQSIVWNALLKEYQKMI